MKWDLGNSMTCRVLHDVTSLHHIRKIMVTQLVYFKIWNIQSDLNKNDDIVS